MTISPPEPVLRPALLDEIVRRASTGRGVVVTGPPGIGRSRLLADVADRLERAGLRVARLVATASAATVPYGVFLGLLDRPTVLRVGSADALGRAALLRAAVLVLDLRAVLVDEASLLDPGSAAFLLELAGGGAAVVVATTAGRPVPDAIQALVSQGRATTARLDPLDLQGCTALADAVLGGPVDGALAAALLDVAEGSPTAVQEVLRTATRTGAVHQVDGLWRLAGELAAPAAARRHAGTRFLAVRDAEQDWLLAVAVAGEVADDLAEAISADAVADAMTRAGWTVHDDRARSTRMRRAVQVEGVLEAAGPRRRRSAIRRLLAAVDGLPRPLSDRERVARGAWLMEIGGELPTEHAVELANLSALSSPDLAEQLLRHAIVTGGGSAAEVALAEHLKRRSRLDEAERLLGAAHPAPGDRHGADEVARILALVSGFGSRRAMQALAALDRHLQRSGEQPDLLAIRAGLLIAELRIEEGLPLARRLRSGPDGFGAVFAGLHEAVALAERGDAFGALEVVEALRGTAARSVDRFPEAPVLLDHAAGWVPTVVCLDVPAGVRAAERTHERLLAEGLHAVRAPFAHLLAVLRTLQGAPDHAVRLLREAVTLPGIWRDANLPALLADLAIAQVHAGDLAGASATLDRAREESVPRIQEVRVRLAESELAAASGRADEAVAIAREAAAFARRHGAAVQEWDARYAAMRHGDPSAADELLALDPLPGAARGWQQDQASAALADDLPALDAVARRLWSAGLRLYAIEAVSEAVRRRAEQDLPATAAAERLAQWTAETPGLRSRAAALPANGLTAREREVVALAARGLPDRAVAEHLGISVRTAQTHLSRAFTKLGVHRRSELAALLQEDV